MEQFGPGKTISFRLPTDTPEHVYQYLNKRKKTLGRKFSSEMAPLFIDAVSGKALKGNEHDTVEIPIPEGLSHDQQEWLTHPSTRAVIGQLLYQMVKQPTRLLELGPPDVKRNSRDTPSSFQTNQTISNFAKKTFLNFGDEDDD